MYPSRFRYEAPRSIDEAIALLQEGGGEAKVLAGGQSLVPLLKLRFAAPELLVDINGLPGLDYHTVDADGTIRIGALCRHADLERSAILAGPAADDGRGRAARGRPHRAQPGHAGRLAVPRRPAGRLGLGRDRPGRPRRRAGNRRAPHASRSPSSSPARSRTRSAYDEIAVEAVIPAPKGTVAGGYLKLERRVGDFATAGVAVAIERSGAVVTRAGIALTGVGGSTIDATDAAQALVGGPLTAERIGAGRRAGGRRPPSRGPTTGAARSTSGTSSARSSSAS